MTSASDSIARKNKPDPTGSKSVGSKKEKDKPSTAGEHSRHAKNSDFERFFKPVEDKWNAFKSEISHVFSAHPSTSSASASAVKDSGAKTNVPAPKKPTNAICKADTSTEKPTSASNRENKSADSKDSPQPKGKQRSNDSKDPEACRPSSDKRETSPQDAEDTATNPSPQKPENSQPSKTVNQEKKRAPLSSVVSKQDKTLKPVEKREETSPKPMAQSTETLRKPLGPRPTASDTDKRLPVSHPGKTEHSRQNVSQRSSNAPHREQALARRTAARYAGAPSRGTIATAPDTSFTPPAGVSEPVPAAAPTPPTNGLDQQFQTIRQDLKKVFPNEAALIDQTDPLTLVGKALTLVMNERPTTQEAVQLQQQEVQMLRFLQAQLVSSGVTTHAAPPTGVASSSPALSAIASQAQRFEGDSNGMCVRAVQTMLHMAFQKQLIGAPKNPGVNNAIQAVDDLKKNGFVSLGQVNRAQLDQLPLGTVIYTSRSGVDPNAIHGHDLSILTASANGQRKLVNFTHNSLTPDKPNVIYRGSGETYEALVPPDAVA